MQPVDLRIMCVYAEGLAIDHIQQQPRTDIGVGRLLLNLRPRRHSVGEVDLLHVDAVVKVSNHLFENLLG